MRPRAAFDTVILYALPYLCWQGTQQLGLAARVSLLCWRKPELSQKLMVFLGIWVSLASDRQVLDNVLRLLQCSALCCSGSLWSSQTHSQHKPGGHHCWAIRHRQKQSSVLSTGLEPEQGSKPLAA